MSRSWWRVEEAGVRLSPGGVVAVEEERSASESQARIAGDARTRVAGALAAFARPAQERVGPRGSQRAESDLAIGHDEIWAGPAVGWAYLVSVIDCCTREIVGWHLSHRCRTEDALAAVGAGGSGTTARCAHR